MKTYTIVEESNNEVRPTMLTSTRKREIISMFNRFIKNMSKSASYNVRMVREGYARYNYVGAYDIIEGEYYITCA